jgi:hypothetical protein
MLAQNQTTVNSFTNYLFIQKNGHYKPKYNNTLRLGVRQGRPVGSDHTLSAYRQAGF